MPFHILSSFPDLYQFGFGSYFFAPTVIRVAAAGVFAYLAIIHFNTKKQVADALTMPRISHETAVLGAWVLIGAEVTLSFALFFGAWTQIAAILGTLGCIKAVFLSHKFLAVYPLSKLVYILTAVLCLVLLISGAGAFAFDLPL